MLSLLQYYNILRFFAIIITFDFSVAHRHPPSVARSPALPSSVIAHPLPLGSDAVVVTLRRPPSIYPPLRGLTVVGLTCRMQNTPTAGHANGWGPAGTPPPRDHCRGTAPSAPARRASLPAQSALSRTARVE